MAQAFRPANRRPADRRPALIRLAPGQGLVVLPAGASGGLGPLGEDAPGPAPLVEVPGPGLYTPGPAHRSAEAPRGFFLDRYIF